MIVFLFSLVLLAFLFALSVFIFYFLLGALTPYLNQSWPFTSSEILQHSLLPIYAAIYGNHSRSP